MKWSRWGGLNEGKYLKNVHWACLVVFSPHDPTTSEQPKDMIATVRMEAGA